MSRRKRNNTLPKRLTDDGVRQLSWNMGNNGRVCRPNNDCIFVPSSQSPCRNDSDNCDMTNCQSSSAEFKFVSADDNHKDIDEDILYELMIYDEVYSSINSSNSSALLGSVGCLPVEQDSFQLTDKHSNIRESNIVVKLFKDVGEGSTCDLSLKIGENIVKGYVLVNATREQIDGLEYLWKKGIVEVVVSSDDLVNHFHCKLMVYLNEAGLTNVVVPSEDPSMKKSHKSMKILMEWLHGPWLPDSQHHPPAKHHDDQIESIFETLKSKENCHSMSKHTTVSANDNNNLDRLQHPSLVPLLRKYQMRAVHWMIKQEADTKAIVTENEVAHPLWKKISLGDKQASYNPHTGRICRDQIFHQGYPSGGILADEMGLGKTVEVLACILNNPRKVGVKIELGETILQTEMKDSLTDSALTSLPASDRNQTLVKDLNHVEAVANHERDLEQMENIQTNEYQLPTGFGSASLPSKHSSEEKKIENINSCNVFLQSAFNAQASDSQLVLSNLNGDHVSNQTNKRPFPPDSAGHFNNYGKKARIESPKAGLEHRNTNETIPSVTEDAVQSNDIVTSHVVLDKTISNTNTKIGHDGTEINEMDNVVFNDERGKDASNVSITVGEVQEPTEGRVEILTMRRDVRCICGKDVADLQEEVLTCTKCRFSQHPKCVGLKNGSEEAKYVCPDCCVHMPLLEANTTLIVSPVTIAHQWLDEIHRHILPGSLNVMMYEGVAKQGFVYPSVLAENDIILTTYDVLKRDFHYLASKKDHHNYRRPKRYRTWPCPLTCITFWRICLDEAQMVESTTAQATETTLNLSTIHRWCITGTPIQKTIDDLYGLFLFVGVEPFYRRTWWKKLLYEPFMKGNSKPLSDVLYHVMWRTAKKDVINEINLPEQKESLDWLNFSPVEYHFYRRQYEDCSRSALEELNKFQESETELNSLDKYSAHRVLWPLLKLRQACCHPQAVRGGYLAVQKSLITMDQLLQSLINKAKNESQDAHRLLLCALNGLAGTYILQENWQSAVDVYREAMGSWKEHEEEFKTDALQKLHTLHNLNEVLSRQSCSRTLRDDYLEEEATEIRKKYLQKWKDQLVKAEYEASNARNAHDELKKKVDFNCPWWMTYLQEIISSENPGDKTLSERLMEKVKSDLAAVTNVQEFGVLSMADSFSDLRGLQLVLLRKFEAIEDCQNNLFRELKSLMVEPTEEMVVSAAECCLRPTTDSTAESCCFCQANDILSVYESLIFGHQGISNTDAESIGGLRAETEALRTLKSIYSFLKSQTKRHDNLHDDAQMQAQCHLEYLDLIKKNFKVYRQLWHALRQRVSALDELAMCTMRLRLRYPGEVVEDNQLYIVEPTQVETTQMGFRSDKIVANSSLRKSLGQLLYLKNLAKTQSTGDGENSEPCPVCTKVLGSQWSVFSCGHCLCCQCMSVLLEQPGISARRGSNVKCPMCRAVTPVQDISYVSTVRQLNEEDKDLFVKGSHSTKIEAVVRTLMKIQKTVQHAKTLIFSMWQDVLDVISHALDENKMRFCSVKKSKDFQSSLEEFKTSDEVHILLIPLQSGSNGLNIIEATHVILVEPSLNPSLERQAVGRIHRIGQTKPTFVHRLLIANTVEEKIMRFLQDKAEFGLRCGTRRTGENIPLTVGELASLFQPTDS